MEAILEIIKLFHRTESVSEFSDVVGIVTKTVGKRVFLTPHLTMFNAISVMADTSCGASCDDISWVGVTLAQPLPVKTLVTSLGGNYERKRNALDDETTLVFAHEGNTAIHCILAGDISDEALEHETFTRLQLVKMR